VYGRYGSWKHQKNSQETALDGFKKALNAALWIHQGYPANKTELAGKQPGETPFKTPIEIPELAQRYKPDLDWSGKVVSSCVHCHMIGSALQAWHRQEKKPMPESLIYPFPEPETIGLTLVSEDIAHVESVAAGSIADQAGIKAGDEFVSFAGQPLISIADITWALHRTPNQGSIAAEVKRGDAKQSVKLTLPQGWRRKSDVSLRGTIWTERGMALGGLRLEACEGEGIGLRVKSVGTYGGHAAAMKAGFKEGDVILSFDSITAKTTETALLGHLLDNHQAGEQVTVVVQRGSEKKELKLPMQ